MTLLDYRSQSFDESRWRESGAFAAVVMNFNKRGLVARAVESTFAQDWPCYEILALDDASTDGGDDEMLAAVRACIAANPSKPLRVVACVNERNAGILGQWRRAVSISDAEWFGMFAADDEALSGRIRVAAATVAKFPGAAAVCTNYIEPPGDAMRWPGGLRVKRRGDLAWGRDRTVAGCTAFWRRRLLELDLPDGNMDDFVLTWLAVIAKCGDIVWNMDEATVRYSPHTGVTTMDRRDIDESSTSLTALYAKYKAIRRRGRRFGRNVWDAIKSFDDRYGTDSAVSRQVRGHWLASWTESGGWFERLRAMWIVAFVDRRNDYGGCRGEIVRKTFRRFAANILGPVSFIPALRFAYRE